MNPPESWFGSLKRSSKKNYRKLKFALEITGGRVLSQKTLEPTIPDTKLPAWEDVSQDYCLTRYFRATVVQPLALHAVDVFHYVLTGIAMEHNTTADEKDKAIAPTVREMEKFFHDHYPDIKVITNKNTYGLHSRPETKEARMGKLYIGIHHDLMKQLEQTEKIKGPGQLEEKQTEESYHSKIIAQVVFCFTELHENAHALVSRYVLQLMRTPSAIGGHYSLRKDGKGEAGYGFEEKFFGLILMVVWDKADFGSLNKIKRLEGCKIADGGEKRFYSIDDTALVTLDKLFQELVKRHSRPHSFIFATPPATLTVPIRFNFL